MARRAASPDGPARSLRPGSSAAERAAAGLGLPARTGQAQRARAAVLLAQGQAARAAETRACRGAPLAPGRERARRGPRAPARRAGARRRGPAARGDGRAHRRARARAGAPPARPGGARAATARAPGRAPGPPRGAARERGGRAHRPRARDRRAASWRGTRTGASRCNCTSRPRRSRRTCAHIFAKLGVRSRAAAAAVVSGVSQAAPGNGSGCRADAEAVTRSASAAPARRSQKPLRVIPAGSRARGPMLESCQSSPPRF